MRFCYLTSKVMLADPDDLTVTRRTDAYEHEQMMDALREALSARCGSDAEIYAIAWDDDTADWAIFNAVIIGTTWDYWDRKDAFLAKLRHIETKTRLFNPVSLVEWNLHKSYLRDLAAKGARLIPTLWLDTPTQDTIKSAFAELDGDDLVFKRQIGAGADGQFRLSRTDTLPDMPHPMMVQRFEPAILTEGEQSFIFIDGAFSHALTKHAASGDYRIQSTYGGFEKPLKPTAADLTAAQTIMAMLDTSPLYARVDMLRAQDGGLMLMELELVEPFLYPIQGPELGPRIVGALLRRLGAG